MKTQLQAAIAICTLCSTSAFAGQITLPTTLDTLLPDGDFAQIGDLTFDSFSYVQGGDMPTPPQINVSELNGAIVFNGPFIDLPNGPGNGASDATLRFTVTSPIPIVEVTMTGNPTIKGASAGNASVVETFEGIDGIKLDIFDQPSGTQLIAATTPIPPTTSLSVTKGINLLTLDPVNEATVGEIREQFVVPEPASLSLIVGVLGLLAVRRRAALG